MPDATRGCQHAARQESWDSEYGYCADAGTAVLAKVNLRNKLTDSSAFTYSLLKLTRRATVEIDRLPRLCVR